MGLFKYGAQCCNNCRHWQCHSQRKIRGNPPAEIYTDSNCDKCSLTNRSTLSKDSCDGFSHLYGASVTFQLPKEKEENPGEDFLAAVMEFSRDTQAIDAAHKASQRKGSLDDDDLNGEDEAKFVASMKDVAEANGRMQELIDEGLQTQYMFKDEAVDFMHFLDKAKSGSAEAQYQFALAFVDGDHGAVCEKRYSSQSPKKLSGITYYWCKKAAEQGYAPAEYMMGELERDGKNGGWVLGGKFCGENYREAVKWFKKAAKHGSEKASAEISKLVEKLTGGVKEYLDESITLLKSGTLDEALSLVRKASKELREKEISLCDFDAAYVEKFTKELTMIAENGSPELQNVVGKMYAGEYASYKNLLQVNAENAVDWFNRAAVGGCLDAMDNLGMCYCNGNGVDEDAAKGVEWYRKAAENGLDWGQYHYAAKLMSGVGVEKNFDEAKKWFGKAANQGMKKAKERLESLADEICADSNPSAAVRAGWSFYQRENYEEAVKYFKNAMEAGLAEATYAMGWCYYMGRGVEEDERKAFDLHRESVDKLIGQNYADACERLASFYEKGNVVESSPSIALNYYTRAARCAYGGGWNAYTAKIIGTWFLNGENGAEKDLGKAVYWLQHAQWMEDGSGVKELLATAQAALESEGADARLAELIDEVGDDFKLAYSGDANAQFKIGNRYSAGEGVDERDGSAALFWWYKSAESGNAQAQHQVGRAYYFGKNVTKNYAEAVSWFLKASEQGLSSSKLFLGTCYRNGRGVGKDYDKAFELYSEAAEKQREAKFWLGKFYEKGWGPVEKNASTAYEWYLKAAEDGDADAICAVGWAYQRGDGVGQDLSKSAEWFGKGVDKGDGVCANNLARLYEDGKGVEQDLGKALELFEKASENKCNRAFYHLGRFYENGLGVDVNLAKAKEYYGKAAEKGDDDAKAALERLG